MENLKSNHSLPKGLEMTFVKKLIFLIIVVALLAMMVGYFISMQNPLAWYGIAFCVVLLTVSVFLGIINIRDEVANKYHWYEQLLDSLSTPLSVTDMDMNWTFNNKPVAKLFHQPKKKFIGKPCNHWGAPICQSEKCGVWRLRKGETETFFSQFDREFRVDTNYLHNLKGERIGHVEVCTDITAILGVAKASQQASESKLRLEEAYEQLKKAQKTLVESEKMASLGSLVAGVAHELNTPIGICVTASTYLHDQAEDFINRLASNHVSVSYLNEFLKNLNESTELMINNLSRTANLITSFKQVSVDQTSDALYRFRMAEQLHQVVTYLRHELKKSHTEIEVRCDPELELNSYPGALVQIYSNLILNSIIHGFDESNPPHKITIDVTNEKGAILIDYSDNGRGIEAELLLKIFEPFVTTKRGQGGSGLGAHIIYNLVTHKLKGTISCDSEPGRGCHFYIRLPLTMEKGQLNLKSDIQELIIETKVSYD